VAVVTGVTGDVGAFVLRALWRRGARVLGVYGRSRRKAAALAAEAKRMGAELLLASVDLRRPLPSRRMAARVAELALRTWGRVDTLVGLAGYPAEGVWQEDFFTAGPERFEQIYRVDTLGQVWFAQALAPALARSRGSIVLMSSNAGLAGDDLGVPFALAKGANVALIKSLARLLAPGVRVNGVAPGALRTSWLRELTPRQRERARRRTLLGRFGEPEEVAEVIADLALGPCRYRTGQVLVLDGGAAL
jgi:3-oxoacyl-[acyl-carrier protein] reductase